MNLTINILRSMRVAKLYNDNQDQITNIHYSNDGMNIITSSSDDQIIIYDCEKGTQKTTLNSKKYGVDLIHFTQNKHHAVHASTKENDIIRYNIEIESCHNPSPKSESFLLGGQGNS